MKRTLQSAYEPIAKRTRANCKNFKYQQLPPVCRTHTPWISATKTRNYFFNDQLSDWLKLYGGRQRSLSNSFNNRNNSNTFIDYIKRKGIDFEANVVNLLKRRIPITSVSDVYNATQVEKTIEYMKQGLPVIHSASLSNKKNNTYGIADLLVRSDYLHKMIDVPPIIGTGKATKLGVDYHYVVIDVKYQTLNLKSDGLHLLNSNSIRAYKSQTWIYNKALGEIQGYTPRYAYILGRRWKYTCKRVKYSNNSCLNKLGIIDFEDSDKFIVMQTKFALSWNRNVIKNGAKWDLNPPTRRELYPNMGADSGRYNMIKKKMARESGELTMLWRCNVKNRNTALDNGISSWKDPQCSSEKLGIGGTYGKVVDKIIKINRDDKIISPDIIKDNTGNWNEKGCELYVDFETFSDICQSFTKLPIQENFNRIYLIGVGWRENGDWKYKKFICKENTRVEELRIMSDFENFINSRTDPKLFYWHAEKNFWKQSFGSNSVLNHNWIDMCQIFRKEPIVIKGCFGFGLKEIAKNMIKHKLITTKLESDCTNGMTAMIRAWKCYNEFSNPITAPIMLDVIKYNEYDVKVLCDIVNYLQDHHV
jgi:hypothetical protein